MLYPVELRAQFLFFSKTLFNYAHQIVEDDSIKVKELLISSKDLDKNGYGLQANEVRGEILRTSEKINRLIVEKQSCFTSEQVVEAQSYIASIE